MADIWGALCLQAQSVDLCVLYEQETRFVVRDPKELKALACHKEEAKILLRRGCDEALSEVENQEVLLRHAKQRHSTLREYLVEPLPENNLVQFSCQREYWYAPELMFAQYKQEILRESADHDSLDALLGTGIKTIPSGARVASEIGIFIWAVVTGQQQLAKVVWPHVSLLPSSPLSPKRPLLKCVCSCLSARHRSDCCSWPST